MNEGDPAGPARTSAARIKQLIDEIQRRGARAFLIHVPFAQEIEGSRLVRITEAIVDDAFPDRALWLPIDPPKSELRWADGVHLDERSALLVVRAIERALAERDGGRRP